MKALNENTFKEIMLEAPSTSLPKQSKRTVWCYLLFVACANFATMLSFLTIYLQHLRFSLAAISAFLLAYQLCKFIFEIPTGFLSDKFGRKAVGQIGLAGMILYYVLLILRPSVPSMVTALAIRGVSESCISGSLESLFIDSLPKEDLARYNALERFCFYMANGVSALLGGILIGAQLYQLSIAVDIVAAIFALLSSTGIRSSSELAHNSTQSNALTLVDAVSMLKSNSMLMSFLAMDFAQAFCFVGLEEFYTLVLQDNGIDATWSGGIIAVQLIATSLFGFLVPALLKGRNKAPMLYRLAIARLVVTALLLVPGTPFPFIPVLYFLGDLLFTLFAPIKYELFQSTCPSEYRATVISTQSQLTSLGAIAFFFLSSILSNALGTQQVLLAALALSSVLYIPALRYVTSGKN